LVNLTCGRNPWKQASHEDSTYRAFIRKPGFLKTILPLSDELNDILERIFNPDPEGRIGLAELKARIFSCSRFTEQPAPMMPQALPTPPASPEPAHPTYVDCEDSIVDDYDYDAPLSPAYSDDSLSDEESTCSSDDGSLTSSCSTIDDFDDDDCIQEPPEVPAPPQPELLPAIYEPEEPRMMGYPHPQDFAPYPPGPIPEAMPTMPMPIPVPSNGCAAPKYHLPFFWDMAKQYAAPPPPPPVVHHPIPFHHQVPLFTSLQGCY